MRLKLDSRFFDDLLVVLEFGEFIYFDLLFDEVFGGFWYGFVDVLELFFLKLKCFSLFILGIERFLVCLLKVVCWVGLCKLVLFLGWVGGWYVDELFLVMFVWSVFW